MDDAPKREDQPGSGTGEGRRRLSASQQRYIALVLVLAAANVAYRLVYAQGWAQTAALYVGVPTILAVGLALIPHSKSTTGMLIKGSTMAMLLACVILPEGLVCLLFAMPLVALVAVIVGGLVDRARKRSRRQGPTLMAVTLPLLLFSLEGVAVTPFDSHDRVTAAATVSASTTQVERALATAPRFDTEPTGLLALGFNRPVGATGTGIAVGDQRTIDFSGGTHDDHPLRLFGLTGERSVDHRSQMHLSVVESRPGRVVFAIDHDMTMLARWVDLNRAVVTWEPIDGSTTRVSWHLEYERLLYPTAYFAPLQRYGMDQAADYLLRSVVMEQLP